MLRIAEDQLITGFPGASGVVEGTGNATRRLKTGDSVKVIGEKGVVEILKGVGHI